MCGWVCIHSYLPLCFRCVEDSVLNQRARIFGGSQDGPGRYEEPVPRLFVTMPGLTLSPLTLAGDEGDSTAQALVHCSYGDSDLSSSVVGVGT